ncbi:TPA: hypothetical protein I7730_00035 [Vibrio vulnificus]|uniref:Uncharacterized protein n=1 Tax=Vibrio vulnificus TaxID=672 RepID=A0A8H9MY19_VIBVL|nr:hypothetical protein [Vibrio vulnificus]HAS8538186.1 hypothetical protein [Vibrio vulnificus]
MMLSGFIRDKNLEAIMTKAHREQKPIRFNGRHTFACVSTMMDELEDLVEQSNSTHQGRYHLKEWLRSFNDNNFCVHLANLEAKKYQEDLVDYIVSLRSKLSGVGEYRFRRDPYTELVRLSENMKEITWSRNGVLDFIERCNLRYIDRGDHLTVPSMKVTDYVFLLNADESSKLKFVTRTVVLVSGTQVDCLEEIANIASLEYVEAVVVVGFGDCPSRIYLTHRLNDIYGSHLSKLLLDSESLFNEVAHIDEGLRDCISDVLSRIKHVDEEFQDYIDRVLLNPSHYRQQVKLLKKATSEASRRLSAADRMGFLYGISQRCLVDLKLYLGVITRACEAKLSSDLSYGDIDQAIHSLINAIQKNRMLYGEKKKGDIHSEEVIASILKTLLETRFDEVFSVTQEEKNGSGFSDIAIKKSVSDLALIECKMLRNANERQKNQKKVAEGMHQVYERYSQRLFCSVPFEPLLYLVLFAVDPNWKEIRKDVENAIESYCERNSLKLTLHGVRNKSCIEVRIRETQGVSERDVIIQVVIVALEDVVNRDDYALKRLDPKG